MDVTGDGPLYFKHNKSCAICYSAPRTEPRSCAVVIKLDKDSALLGLTVDQFHDADSEKPIALNAEVGCKCTAHEFCKRMWDQQKSTNVKMHEMYWPHYRRVSLCDVCMKLQHPDCCAQVALKHSKRTKRVCGRPFPSGGYCEMEEGHLGLCS